MESSILSDLAFEQSFLNGLSAGQMEKVIAMARVVPFAPDQIIFREREPPNQVYLILSGSVALKICTPVHILRVQTLEEGDEPWAGLFRERTQALPGSIARGSGSTEV